MTAYAKNTKIWYEKLLLLFGLAASSEWR